MPERSEITTRSIDSVIGWTVIRAARQAGRILTLALKRHDLTPVEFGVLSQLAAAKGEMTQAEVARATEIRPQSVAPVIDGLHERGLLRRENARGRGRSGRIVLTDDGFTLLQEAFPAVLATNAAFADPADDLDPNTRLLHFLARQRDLK